VRVGGVCFIQKIVLGISMHISRNTGKCPDYSGISCEVHLFQKGVKTDFKKPDSGGSGSGRPEQLEDATRGNINHWSAASRARLRDFLLTHNASGKPFAITLTVPGDVLPLDEWQSMTKLFWSYVQRKKIPSVWRVELQERKQPHLHVISWGDDSGVLCTRWRSLVRALPPVTFYTKSRHKVTCSRMALNGAYEHCTEIEQCDDDSSRWWRYLCEHTSKKKQAQLGYKGRQWGVVHRAGFASIVPESYSLELSEWFRFMRVLRRLTKSRKWRGSKGASVWFSNPDSIRRLLDWAVE